MRNLLTRLTGCAPEVVEREARNMVAAVVIGLWIVAVAWAVRMWSGG